MHRAKRTESVLDSEMYTNDDPERGHRRHNRVLEHGFHAPMHAWKVKQNTHDYHCQCRQ